MIKQIDVPESFYEDFQRTDINDTYYAIILLQNAFYHLDQTDLESVNERAKNMLGLETGKPTKLTKIFPQYIGEYIFKYTSEKKRLNILSFLKELGIDIRVSKTEITFF
jgi:hypothetical protein